MGRPRGSPNKLDLEVPEEAQSAFEAFLDGLGLDERAISEGYGEDRSIVSISLRAVERTALDDASEVILPGASLRGATNMLARAIVRSWLIHTWNHPAELVKHDFGEGHRWSDSLNAVREEAGWPEGSAGPEPTFATLIARVEKSQRLGVARAFIAQLSEADRRALRSILSE